MGQPQQEKKNYVNGIFAKRVWTDGDRQLFSLGVKKAALIKELQSLKENENGFVNLTMGTQKDNTEKFSVWVDDYIKTNASSSSSQKTTNSKPATKQTQSASVEADDDLPF